MRQQQRFEMIECSGTPYEIGHQIGSGCRANIAKALQITIGGLSWFHHTKAEDIIANAMKFRPLVEDFNPQLIDQLNGVAAGADIGFEEAFTLQCGFDLGGYYAQLAGMCTSFAVTGEAAADGQTILGQTIDWFPGSPMSLVRITHGDGVKQLKLILWGVAEYTLNAGGYGMCANGTWAAVDKYRFNLPMGFYLEKAMRQASMDAAVDILRSYARGLGYFHLASADGNMVGIESIQGDFEMIGPDRQTLVHSNHYLTERFRGVDMVNVMIPDSPARVARMRTLIDDNYGRITPELMMELMADHHNQPGSICRHVDPGQPPEMASVTLASYIMVPEQGLMYIAAGNPCQYDFVRYSL